MENNILELIKTRRSIRKYKPTKVSKEHLNSIIEAGLYAPTSANAQPWHFTVIQNQELINELNEDVKEAIRNSDLPPHVKKAAEIEGFSFFYHAPTLILVSEEDNTNEFSKRSDVAVASQNMMLQAHALGLGSCWIGAVSVLFDGSENDKYMEMFNIPKGFTPSHVIIVGEKESNPTRAPKRRENTVNFID